MCKCKGYSFLKVAKWLVIIGGINWGLVGLGMLLGKSLDSWNLVHWIFSSVPVVEGIIYVLVGIAAIMKIFGCKCKKCCDVPATGTAEEPKMGTSM